jgi:hypothetical protein
MEATASRRIDGPAQRTRNKAIPQNLSLVLNSANLCPNNQNGKVDTSVAQKGHVTPKCCGNGASKRRKSRCDACPLHGQP